MSLERDYFDENELPFREPEEFQLIALQPTPQDDTAPQPPPPARTPETASRGGLYPGAKALFHDPSVIEAPRLYSDSPPESPPAMKESPPAGSDDDPADQSVVLAGDAATIAAESEDNMADGKASGDGKSSTAAIDAKLQITAEQALTLQVQPVVTRTNSTSDDSLSPILQKHFRTYEGTQNTLPAVHASSPNKDGAAVSPQTKLPPIHQAIGPLSKLAELANQQHRHPQPPAQRHSFSAATSPSSAYFPRPSSIQASPRTQSFSARSPTSTLTDSTHHNSPTTFTGFSHPFPRRSSTATEYDGYGPPALHSLVSASSSSEGHGTAGSSTDGISTAQTTPIESGLPIESPGRVILPPPGPGVLVVAPPPLDGYKCDFPGCTAASFQTQYLLKSHKNVHNNIRTHYCPVKGCPRSGAGNGFKRKNEMIRHGLVHDSPGFVCPYCPDRDHRYPRPDNLQRHVRAHHKDKKSDDPALLKVLDQRAQNAGGKHRRRRTQTQSGAAPEEVPARS